MTGPDAFSALVPITQPRVASERVGEQLRMLIASGNIAAGEKLPSENELARALQVSRPVVREALRGLSMMGIVESRQGGGCFVTDLDPKRLMEPLSFYLQLRDYSMDELFRARQLIDSGIAGDAARNATADQRTRLIELARLGKELVDDPVGFRVLDAQFHGLISEASGNAFLLSVSNSLYSLAIDLRRKASEMPGVLTQSAADHIAIAEAIRDASSDGASRAMGRHVDHIRATTSLVAKIGIRDAS
ncbi:MAG: FadR family transcriptional regulator [Tabrizicola sp.]|nr:FadR family transcriptional regulator [Tabrizicola sp.]